MCTLLELGVRPVEHQVSSVCYINFCVRVLIYTFCVWISFAERACDADSFVCIIRVLCCCTYSTFVRTNRMWRTIIVWLFVIGNHLIYFWFQNRPMWRLTRKDLKYDQWISVVLSYFGKHLKILLLRTLRYVRLVERRHFDQPLPPRLMRDLSGIAKILLAYWNSRRWALLVIWANDLMTSQYRTHVIIQLGTASFLIM